MVVFSSGWHQLMVTSSTVYLRCNKLGKLITCALRDKRVSLYIPSIKTSSAAVAHLTTDILHSFQEYYHTLYNLPSPYAHSTPSTRALLFSAFLAKTALPRIPAHVLEEIQTAISSLPLGKSPGPDGYTAEFYKVLAEDLISLLLASIL